MYIKEVTETLSYDGDISMIRAAKAKIAKKYTKVINRADESCVECCDNPEEQLKKLRKNFTDPDVDMLVDFFEFWLVSMYPLMGPVIKTAFPKNQYTELWIVAGLALLALAQ